MTRAQAGTGHQSQKRTRRVPRDPVPSTFTLEPTGLPLDFYDPTYFNALSTNDQLSKVNVNKVIFLPKAEKSLFPHPHTHPDEKLSDSRFNKEYYNVISKQYIIKSLISSSESDSSETEEGYTTDDYGKEIDLQAASPTNHDENFYPVNGYEFDSPDEQSPDGSSSESQSSSSENQSSSSEDLGEESEVPDAMDQD